MSKTIWLNWINGFLNATTLVGLIIAVLMQQDIVSQHPDAVAFLAAALAVVNTGVAVANTVLRWLGGLPLTNNPTTPPKSL